MAKKDNNGYIGNPNLGIGVSGIISRNKNFDTRYYTQYNQYADAISLMSSPIYVDTRPVFTGSLSTGGGKGATATASLSNGSIVGTVIYSVGSGYSSNTLITMSFSGGGGVDAGAYVSSTGGGTIVQITPFYSIQDIIIADPGGPYTTAPTLSFSAPGQSLGWRPAVTAVASASITDGKLTGFTIHKSGSNYVTTSWPTITVSNGGLAAGGKHAVLVPVLRNGRDYTSNPTLTITSPAGTGAVISASFLAGISSIDVTNEGIGYISPPSVQIQGAAIAYTSASATLNHGTVSTISVKSGSASFPVPPIINISGGLPPLPEITNNQIAAWYGVYENNSNWVGLQITTNGGGGYTVNWGDGTSNNYNTNATASKQYTTASFAALTSSIYSTTDLYKPALITVTLSDGATSFATVDYTVRPTTPTGSLNNTSPSNWKSIKMTGDQVSRIALGTSGSTRLTLSQLERFEYSGSNKITNFNSAFANCFKLNEIVSLYTTSGSNMGTCFAGCHNLSKIPALDFTSTTIANNVFSGCYSLRNITLLNSQNVTNWSFAFNTCYNVQSINANFSNAGTTFNNTLTNCYRLVNISPIDISNVTDATQMFNNCISLKSVQLIGTTSKMTTTANMFNNCGALESLPLAMDFTQNQNATGMFSSCKSLTSVPILTNTTKLTNISNMFAYCSALKIVPFFDTSNVTNASSIFTTCLSITSIPKFNFSRNTQFQNMFAGCSNLQSIPNLETSNGTEFNAMFQQCTSIAEIPWLNTSKGTNFSYMFYLANSIAAIPEFDLSQAQNTQYMFGNCISLVNVPFFNLAKVTLLTNMFTNCFGLISVPYMNIGNVTDASSMFNNCFSLREVGGFDTAKVTNFTSMFQQCYTLTSIPTFNTNRGTNFTSMFSVSGIVEIPPINMSAGTTLTSMFSNSYINGIKRIRATGMNASFDVSNLNLDSVALNEIYTNASATGAGKTITVTGNWGAATDNPAIATAKGWAVTG
jgi:surface protein